jgi:tetratricopeptide (TPR) repeat protein
LILNTFALRRVLTRHNSAVTGELDKAAQTFQEEIESYPREPSGYTNLGGAFASLGQYEKAAELERQALPLAPDIGGLYANLAEHTLALQRHKRV